jgi:hypothetical protein
MKSKAGVLVLTLLVVGGIANASISTPTVTTDSSPLFAVSLNRAVDEFEGRRPKGGSPADSNRLKAAVAAQGATTQSDCTYTEGCQATVGGYSCDYSTCTGCQSTYWTDYTCQDSLSCGVYPTENASSTCSGFGSTCGSGCSTAQANNCNNTSSAYCSTYSGQNTCSTTCSTQYCSTSGGSSCATQWGSTCDMYCEEPTMNPPCETTADYEMCGQTGGSTCQ